MRIAATIASVVALTTTTASAATREEILLQAVQVAERAAEVRETGRNWQDAPYLVGCTLVWEQLQAGDPGAAQELWNLVDTTTNTGNSPVTHGDRAAYSQAAMDIYRLIPVEEQAARAAKLLITDEPLRFAGLVINHTTDSGPPLAPWWVDDGYGSRYWQDDLFMVVPWLAMRGSGRDGLPAEQPARDLAYEWIQCYAFDHRLALVGVPDSRVPSLREPRRHGWELSDPASGRLLLDPATGLWWHDENTVGSEIFWGRGNGWAAAALVRAQHYLDQPYGGSRYDRITDRMTIRRLITRMAASLWTARTTTGGWPADLKHTVDDPPAESSATALLVYAVARAVNEGWLDDEVYVPAVLKAFHHLRQMVDDEGDLHYVQTPAAGPAGGQILPSDAAGHNLNYGVGAWLMAAAEVSRFNPEWLSRLENVQSVVVARDLFEDEGEQLVIGAAELSDFGDQAATASSLAAISEQLLLAATYHPEDNGTIRVEDSGSGPVALFLQPATIAPVLHTVIVPAAANSPGLHDTSWTTDVIIHNPGSLGLSVDLDYMPITPGSEPAAAHSLEVPGLSSLVLENVVENTLATAGTGALRISTTNEAVVESTTFTRHPGGDFGLTLSGSERFQAIVAGERAHLLQLESSELRRTNLGCASFGRAAEVLFEIFDLGGTRLAQMQASINPGRAWMRSNALQSLLPDHTTEAYAVVSVLTPGVAVLPWAAVVDTATGDPALVGPSVASSATLGGANLKSGLWITAVAHQDGLNGTHWRSDLSLHNPGATPASCTLVFRHHSGLAGETTEHHIDDLPAASSLRFEDVVATTFGRNGSGTIQIVPTSGILMASSRTFNQDHDGRFGQQIAAVPGSDGFRQSETALLVGLMHSQDSDMGERSNIGMVNISDQPITLSLSLFDSDGSSLTSRHLQLGPGARYQIHDALGQWASADLAGAWVELQTQSDGGAFLAYASVVDNRSGDARYIPARRIP